jgi:hypothetical protein
MEKDMNWKPIETAPKDQELLIYGYSAEYRDVPMMGVATWQPYSKVWVVTDGFYFSEALNWMPLPTPPKPDLSDKGDPRFQMFRAGKEARDAGLSIDHAPDVMEGEHRQIWLNGWHGRDQELKS